MMHEYEYVWSRTVSESNMRMETFEMETSSRRARVADRIPVKRYSGCSEVQVICCTAVLSNLQLSRLACWERSSMSRTENVEITVRKSFCICLAVALDIIRIHWFSARRVDTMMLVRIEMISVGVFEGVFFYHLGQAVLHCRMI